MAAEYFIRPAEEKDAQAIVDLIMALAIYEKEPESAKATPELIRENLFKNQFAQALLAFEGTQSNEGKAVGLALYFFNFSTWTGRPGIYLEDLFVDESKRGAGIGKALFRALGEVAKEKNCARMDWVVLKWNQPSIDFYDRLKAKPMHDWLGYRLEGEALADLANLK